jgi:hypothetical protein
VAEANVADAPESTIDAIRPAFAGVPRGRMPIHEAEFIDRHEPSGERPEARRLDASESWHRVAELFRC